MTNVDADDVARFDTLAERWWDPDGAFKPLHDINPLRVRWIDSRAPLAGRRVLDIGCGGGLLSEAMAREGARVTAIDPATASIEVARRHAADGGLDIDYRVTTAEALAESEAQAFDVVTCLEMLEHVPDPAAVVAAAGRLLRPGGHAFFSTINRNTRSWWLAVVGAEYVLRLLPRGTHRHDRFIKPSELASYARRGGLDLYALEGLAYNPVTRRYRLGADVAVNYLAACRHTAAN